MLQTANFNPYLLERQSKANMHGYVKSSWEKNISR